MTDQPEKLLNCELGQREVVSPHSLEVELVDRSITTAQREAAIESILREYKQCRGQDQMGLASA